MPYVPRPDPPILSQREWALLYALWILGPATWEDILIKLGEFDLPFKVSEQSMQAILSNLIHDKGLVRFATLPAVGVGRPRKLYEATLRYPDALRAVLRDFRANYLLGVHEPDRTAEIVAEELGFVAFTPKP